MDSPRTSLATSSPDAITVAGRDPASELTGEVDLSGMAFLVVAGGLPAPERR